MGAVREKRKSRLGLSLTLCHARRGVVLVALDKIKVHQQLARWRFEIEIGIVEVISDSEIDLLSWSNALPL